MQYYYGSSDMLQSQRHTTVTKQQYMIITITYCRTAVSTGPSQYHTTTKSDCCCCCYDNDDYYKYHYYHYYDYDYDYDYYC
eukprot:6466331-Pyramimonas_sp.AAC.1